MKSGKLWLPAPVMKRIFDIYPQTVSVVNRSKINTRALQPSLLPVLTEQIDLFVTPRGVMGYGMSGGAARKYFTPWIESTV